MTKQEIFDKAVAGLASQGFRRSMGSDSACVYRGRNGMKCAIGHLIPDEKYEPEWDDGNSSHLEDVLPAIGIPREFEGFCAQLQGAHDLARIALPQDQYEDRPDAMRHALRGLAVTYGLVIPAVLSTETT